MASRVRGILEHLLGRRLDAAMSEVVSDSELLRRFTTTRDEAAFELLVWRYGSMVLGLCKRAIRDEQLAEDAFQAVFLVLVRKADSVRGNVGGWLFRVARRVSARALKRKRATQPVPELATSPEPVAAEQRELTDLLDAEVARLPDRLRRAVILCYLGDHTTEDAARELGCPRGTVLSRLATARKRLAERLTRRGVALPAAGIVIAERTTGRLVSQTVATVQNPFRLPASTGPAFLAESVVRAMTTTKLVAVCGIAVLAIGLTFGVGWVAAGTGSSEFTVAPVAATEQATQPPAAPAKQVDKKDTKPADRAAQLRKYTDQIDTQIAEFEISIIKNTQQIANTVDVSVLQSELIAIDKDILETEKSVQNYTRTLEQLAKGPGNALKQALEESAVMREIDSQGPFFNRVQRLNRNKQELENLKLDLKEDDPKLQAAIKGVAEEEEALMAARAKARPEIERRLREAVEKNHATAIKNANSSLAFVKAHMADLEESRRKLVERIARVRQSEASRQVLQDQLRVLREIQLELFRQRTLTELGMEGLQTAGLGPVANTGADAQLRELRREIETLRKDVSPEKNTKVEDQLKELRQEIESMRRDMQRMRNKKE